MLVLPEASTRTQWCGYVLIVWYCGVYPPPSYTLPVQGLSGIEVNVRTSGPVVAERRGITPLPSSHTHTLRLPARADGRGDGEDGGGGGMADLPSTVQGGEQCAVALGAPLIQACVPHNPHY